MILPIDRPIYLFWITYPPWYIVRCIIQKRSSWPQTRPILASNEEALFDKVHPSLHPSLALPSAVRRARPRGQSSDERGPKSESADGRLEKAKFFLAFSSCCSKNNKQVFIPYKKLTIIGWLLCELFEVKNSELWISKVILQRETPNWCCWWWIHESFYEEEFIINK